MKSETMIDLVSIGKNYGDFKVIESISLSISKGEFVVLVGPSGSGKSTLLRMIAGLEEISSGECWINGNMVNHLAPKHRGIAMVFQNYALYPHMTVYDNLAFALKVQGLNSKEISPRVLEIAKIVQLGDYLKRKPAQLSGGQRQRVAMARAMIRDTRLFLFDEPLSNLDAQLRTQMRVEIRKLHNKLNATSIYVTHDQTEAMTLADRIVVLDGGHIEQVGMPEELYENPITKFVAGFLGTPSMNFLSASSVGLNSALTVGIRPKKLRLEHVNESDVGFDARLDLVEYLGSNVLYHCVVGDTAVVVERTTEANPKPKSGDNFKLYTSPESLLFFDGNKRVMNVLHA